MTLLLRIFADCKNDQQAKQITAAVSKKLAAYTPNATMSPERYWKISHYFEFCFALLPDNSITFNHILAYTENWLLLGNENHYSAVWNRSIQHEFLLPEIAWVELILD